MAEAVDRRRDTLDAGAMRDRRNGTCRRCLLGEPGDIERDVPRTRHFCPTGVPKGSARRAPEIDRAIPAGAVPGLSTRKVGEGLLAALPVVRHGIPVRRCRAHRIRNILDRVRVADQQAVMNAGTRPEALAAARRFADHWQGICPGAVASLRNDPDDLLACFRYRTLAGRRQVRTTNAIERRFREVRRRTRPAGTFRDRTSMDRIPNAVFIHEDRSQGISTPLSLTHDP